MGEGLRIQGDPDPDLGQPLFRSRPAYDSETYCDEIKGKLADIGIAISEFSTHFQGQMVSVHPAYDAMFDGQCPAAVRGNPEKRRLWAADQVRKAALRFASLWPDRACDLHRLARLALFLSLSAAAGRTDRGMLRRAGPPLEADPRRL